jgi:isopenicillin N synthase-like dioxygenase
MKFLIIFLFQMYVCTLNNDYNQEQCDNMCSLNLNEIDISKFISGTNEEKKEIALLFDKTFHEYGVIRLVNNSITAELIDKTREFFSLNLETKMKYFVNGSFHDTPGYKPIGLESVANYKGQKKASSFDSAEIFFTFFKSQSKEFNFSIDQLPESFRDVIPEYILQSRQLISYVHSIADMALELDENTFDKNYTNDNATFTLRLTKYLPTKNEEQLALGAHQDYLGFTLLHNDDVSGV